MTTMAAMPCWPQLPHRSFAEERFNQSAMHFPGFILDTVTRHAYVDRAVMEQHIDQLSVAYLSRTIANGALTIEHATGLTELLRMPAEWFTGRAICSQQVGPISLALRLTDEQQRSLIYDPVLLEAVAHHLSLRIAWLANQFANLAADTITYLDEPFLDAFNTAFFPLDWDRGLELLELVLADGPGCRGVLIGGVGHRETNASVYWAPLLETSIELIGLDVYYHGELLLNAAHLLPDFLDRPGFLTWGLIPADADMLALETTESLVKRFQQLVNHLVKANVPRDQLLAASFISTSSSLEHLPIDVAEHALKMCVAVSNQIRSTYRLEANET